jgi:DNA (cytosine-5)-methyltransferase 1
MKINSNTADNSTVAPLLGMQCYSQPFRVLNLYACLGGNRYLWEDCEVTAVELDPELARMYKERFPNDTVIVADAHQYLLDHYQEFDFVWSSPPCPSHSRARFWSSSNEYTATEAVYPDMKLYEEIIFLDHYFKGKWVVENVIPYYQPLIPAQKRGRHLYWTNFNLPNDLGDRRFKISATKNEVQELCKFHKIDLSSYKGEQRKDKIARNLVDYEAGKTIFNTARGIIEKSNTKQSSIFDLL